MPGKHWKYRHVPRKYSKTASGTLLPNFPGMDGGYYPYWYQTAGPRLGTGKDVETLTNELNFALRTIGGLRPEQSIKSYIKALRVSGLKILQDIIRNCPTDDLEWASKGIRGKGFYNKKESGKWLERKAQDLKRFKFDPGTVAVLSPGKRNRWELQTAPTALVGSQELGDRHDPGTMKKFYYVKFIGDTGSATKGLIGIVVRHLFWERYVKYVDEEGGPYVAPYLLTRKAIKAELGRLQTRIVAISKGKTFRTDAIDDRIYRRLKRKWGQLEFLRGQVRGSGLHGLVEELR